MAGAGAENRETGKEGVKQPGASVRESADWLATSLLVPSRDLIADDAAEDLVAKGIQSIELEDFSKLRWENRLRMASDFKKDEKLAVGRKLKLDFYANPELRFRCSLRDFLPPEVRKIRYDDKIYERRGNQGFYHDGESHMLLSGAEVEVVELAGGYSAEQDYEKKFGGEYQASKEAKLDAVKMSMIAHDFAVDGYLLEAVLRVLKPNDLGFKGDEREFAEMLAMAIAGAETKYESTFDQAVDAGRYGGGFLMSVVEILGQYFSKTVDRALWKKVAHEYAGLRGFTFSDDDLETAAYKKVDNRQDYVDRTGIRETPVYAREYARVRADEQIVNDVDHFGNTVSLRYHAMLAFKRAKRIAEKKDFRLKVGSSYRDIDEQEDVWDGWSDKHPELPRQQYVAAPGTSPHHAGGTLDLNIIDGGGNALGAEVLASIMVPAGFVRYWREGWHWEIYTGMWRGIVGMPATAVSYKLEPNLDRGTFVAFADQLHRQRAASA